MDDVRPNTYGVFDGKSDMNWMTMEEIYPLKPVEWEYRFDRYTWSVVSPESERVIEQRFNRLGREGWELVSTELVEQVRWRRKYVAIFKRIRMNDNTQSEPDTTQRQQDQDLSELPS